MRQIDLFPRTGNSIFTYSGNRFWPLDPRSEEILIDDIAQSLSLICRFNGHICDFYSVAQHSVHVSYLCDKENALWGLLHDASEAYLADIPRPIKSLLPGYKDREKQVMEGICNKFGLPIVEPPDVKTADNVMLATEMRDLMPNMDESPPDCPEPEEWNIEPWHFDAAKKIFLQRFDELVNATS